MQVEIPNGFTPRPYQARAMRHFDRGGKRAITVWHRRAGKDLTAAHQACKAAHQVIGQYWHFFPTFKQARRSVWQGITRSGERILEQVFPGFLDPGRPGSIVKAVNQAEMTVELKCGSLWRLMGSDHTEAVGAGPQGVVFSEFALCKPSAWDFVRPMLRESGGWAWFITTPRGRNHAKKLYDAATPESGWYRDTQTVHDTGLTYASNRAEHQISPEEMMAEERAEGMAEELIRQEYLCDWTAALLGAVWGDLLEQAEARGALQGFGHSNEDVFTSWDLGMSDSTSIWFWQPVGTGAEVIDFYENRGKPLSHYTDLVMAKPYRYVTHWLPHDARARTLVTGESVHERAREYLGDDKVAITPSMSLLDGIQAGRYVLQQEDTRIHPRCGEGVEALRSYHYEYDEDRKTFGRKPEHDWSSHAADGFRYLSVVRRVAPSLVPAKPKATAGQPAGLTLDELWASRDSSRRQERI